MFDRLPSYHKLKEYSRDPFDLTVDETFTVERVESMYSEACGLKMMYAAERVSDDVIDALALLAAESDALGAMKKMQDGAIVNRIEGVSSENRRVLHTAMRDIFDARNEEPSARMATDLAKIELGKLESFLDDIGDSSYTDMVLVGIGGSDLGPRALYTALKAYARVDRRVHFISNVDPDDATAIIEGLDLSNTLVVVVSKSGTTLETLTNEAFVARKFADAGLDIKDHIIAVTGEGSPMDNPEHYSRVFYMWDYVGGRYSVTSMVGGVVLGFSLGYDAFIDILRGAHDMDMNALEPDVRHNLPLLSALIGIWNRNFLDHDTVAVIPYSQALLRFTAHLQQCGMESNGKHVDRQGHVISYATSPIVWGEPGTNAQHSFYQLLHQGTTVVPVELIGFKASQYGRDLEVQGTTSQQKLIANMIAQALAFALGKDDENPNKVFEGNRPTTVIVGNKLDPYTMGALLALYENRIAFQGFIWNINSFDQEGVQLGKVLATKILDAMKCPEKCPYPIGQAFLRHIELM